MKHLHLLVIILLIVFAIPYSSFGVEYIKCTCSGKCHGRDVEQSATKLLATFSLDERKCIENAKRAFGGHCGGLAGCDSGCADAEKLPIKDLSEASQCCKDWCLGFFEDEPAYFGCIQSCEAGCRANDLSNQFISVFQYIAVVIAAIMLSINGIKFITSDSPYDRDQAKHSIRYILIALIILALVIYLTSAIFAPIQVPGGETTVGDCTSTEAEITPITLPPGTTFISPVSPTPLCSSAYYLRDIGECEWHDGIDLAVADGTPMVAPVTGKVVRVGLVSGYGNTVVIHIPGTDMIVFTAHMKSTSVNVGDDVEIGVTPIGKSGDTGTPGSYHIHLGVHTGYTGGRPDLDRCCGIDCGSCKGPCSRDPREFFDMFGSCVQDSPCAGVTCSV